MKKIKTEGEWKIINFLYKEKNTFIHFKVQKK